jgi:hypothetical protein
MFPMTRKGVIAAVVIAVSLAALAGGAVWLVTGDPPYDRAFETRVEDPAYPGGGPVVVYDEGHRNIHTTTTGYKPLAELLRSDGYSVRVSGQPLSASTLEGVSVLLLVVPRGANETEDGAAYSEDEAGAIESWVRGGGSLLLIADHWPFGAAVAPLAKRFDVDVSAGMAQDPTEHDAERGDSHLVYSEENRLLRDHPIIRGRKEAERVRRVVTFTGTSLRGPAGAVPFLALSDAATDRPPGTPRVKRDGGDVRIEMDYGEPVGASGRAQGLALEFGAGRMVVLADAGMLRAQRPRGDLPVGMNVPGYDNRQLALNIIHWLSRAL